MRLELFLISFCSGPDECPGVLSPPSEDPRNDLDSQTTELQPRHHSCRDSKVDSAGAEVFTRGSRMRALNAHYELEHIPDI